MVKPHAAPAARSRLRRRADLGPGLRRDLGIEAGGAEQVLVVIQDRRRAVERERQHVAGDIGIIAGHGRKIGGRRKRLGLVPHQFEHRIDRALRRHHGRGRDFVDLDDGGLAARAKREDRRRDGLGVVALVARHDPVFGLRGVEIGGQLLQLPPEFARHRMPPHDIGDRVRRRRRGERRRGDGELQRSAKIRKTDFKAKPFRSAATENATPARHAPSKTPAPVSIPRSAAVAALD